MHVAGLGSGLVEFGDQRFGQIRACQRWRAHDHCIGAAIRNQADASGIRAGSGSARFHQFIDHDRDIGGYRVAYRHHIHISGGGSVQRGNDFAEPGQVVGIVGNHQRIVARVGIDRIVGRNQRPQHRHQIASRFIIQAKNPGSDLVALEPHRIAPDLDRRRLQLGVGFRHHFGVTVAGHHRITLQTQGGCQQAESLRLGQRRFGHQIDGALDARINDESGVGVVADGFDHRFDIGADKIQRRFVIGSRPGWRDDCYAQQQYCRCAQALPLAVFLDRCLHVFFRRWT